jgi:hypothetical protein
LVVLEKRKGGQHEGATNSLVVKASVSKLALGSVALDEMLALDPGAAGLVRFENLGAMGVVARQDR